MKEPLQMRVRRSVVLAVTAAGIAVAAASSAAVALAMPRPQPAAVPVTAAGPPAQVVTPVATTRPGRPAKQAEPYKVAFSGSGVITAVDPAARTFALRVDEGIRDLLGRTVTFKVAAHGRITVNGGAPATLAAVSIGARTHVAGYRTGGILNAVNVLVLKPPQTTAPAPAATSASPAPVRTPARTPAQTPTANPPVTPSP